MVRGDRPPLHLEREHMASPDAPLEGFAHFFEVAVAVPASRKRLYDLVTDIEGLSEFFPSVSFKLDSDAPLTVGSMYYTRQKGSKTWVPYRVLVLDPNARMSAELTGKDPLFEALRYDHRFVTEGSTTISRERVDYTFKYGYAGRVLNFVIGKRLVRKQVLDAHRRLREVAKREEGGPPPP
jgi:ribosome-associated toxin RatA of RatAB toxin-antitoxin module